MEYLRRKRPPVKTFSMTPSENTYRKINCPVCGSGSFRDGWNCGEWRFVRCCSCGLMMQNPQPEPSELARRYDEGYFGYELENEQQFLNLMLLGLEDLGFGAIEKSLLAAAGKPAVLDIGCATGRLLSELAGRGWEARGVEICPESAGYGIKERGLDIHIGDLESACFPDNSFDLIHCSHVIEHVTDPKSFTAEAARILKPGGYFAVVTPDVSGFQAKLFGARWRSAIADHMFLFSSADLFRLLGSCGFRIERKVSWGGLAAGTAPAFLKKIADRAAKRFNFGDVTAILGVRQ